MKKYIYSPHHQGAVLAPLMGKPDKDRFRGIDPGFFEFDHIGYNKAVAAYNTWLSSPPAYKVRPEDIKYFLEPIDESQFEVVEEWQPYPPPCRGSRLVLLAIPKKGNDIVVSILSDFGNRIAGNESKEQRPSVDQWRKILYETKESLACHYYAARNDKDYPMECDREEITIVIKKLQSLIHQPYK